jgi:primosomal protein N' (replication factor Y) (superfamily II helicase)
MSPERDRVVRVLPDVKGFEKRFDYLVPESMASRVFVGSMVRIELAGRRVGAWVTEVDVEPPAGVTLRPIAKVTGRGPTADLFELADWVAWRWAGRPQHFLTTASPDTAVVALPAPRRNANPIPVALDPWLDRAFAEGGSMVRLPPANDPYDIALAACRRGNALIVCPSVSQARLLGARLRRAGVGICLYPRDWAQAAAGSCVIGARAAVAAPMVDLAAIVVIDEHDEGLQQEQQPTWHARDVAIERARRAGVPCVLTSPFGSLEARAAKPTISLSTTEERAGWATFDIVDRNDEDPATRSNPVGSLLMRAVQSDATVVCVLNTKGVARLLACASCRAVTRCEQCDAAVEQHDERLVCRRCGTERPVVCASCGAGHLKLVRRGVSRLRQELEAAAKTDVIELSGLTANDAVPVARLYVGTEAALHQLASADVVAFIDFDSELLAPRYRADEQALGLLARASRLVGGRRGRVIVQTTQADHVVLQSALLADPDRWAAAAIGQRRALQLPPAAALAELSGAGAAELAATLRADGRVAVLGPSDDRWLIRATDGDVLSDALDDAPRPADRVRIAVDPPRI